MPISSQEKIPNLPLTGSELAKYVMGLLDKVLAERGVLSDEQRMHVVTALSYAMTSDWVFRPQFTYANVSFEIAVLIHALVDSERFAFTLEPVFHFPSLPVESQTHKPFVRRPVGITAPPLGEWRALNAESIVDCFTISAKVENPNLVRVHVGLPVVIQAKTPPPHGEMFSKIEDHEVRYDPTDYPPLPEPTVTDQSAEFARKWGVTSLPDREPRAGSTHTPSFATSDDLSGIESQSGVPLVLPTLSAEPERREILAAGGEAPAPSSAPTANELMQERRTAKRRDRGGWNK